MSKRKKEEKFEEQLERLEVIVARLEDESVGLEQSLELFEEGMALAKACRERLEAIELRIDELLDPNDDPEADTAPLEID